MGTRHNQIHEVELNVNADFHNFDMFNISFLHKMSKYLFHEHNYEGRSHGKMFSVMSTRYVQI